MMRRLRRFAEKAVGRSCSFGNGAIVEFKGAGNMYWFQREVIP